jgi:hypothetical protein
VAFRRTSCGVTCHFCTPQVRQFDSAVASTAVTLETPTGYVRFSRAVLVRSDEFSSTDDTRWQTISSESESIDLADEFGLCGCLNRLVLRRVTESLFGESE